VLQYGTFQSGALRCVFSDGSHACVSPITSNSLTRTSMLVTVLGVAPELDLMTSLVEWTSERETTCLGSSYVAGARFNLPLRKNSFVF
jgi:hypothetical protein